VSQAIYYGWLVESSLVEIWILADSRQYQASVTPRDTALAAGDSFVVSCKLAGSRCTTLRTATLSPRLLDPTTSATSVSDEHNSGTLDPLQTIGGGFEELMHAVGQATISQ
jgi:hypothetical protein